MREHTVWIGEPIPHGAVVKVDDGAVNALAVAGLEQVWVKVGVVALTDACASWSRAATGDAGVVMTRPRTHVRTSKGARSDKAAELARRR
jgi:hypothetical protein